MFKKNGWGIKKLQLFATFLRQIGLTPSLVNGDRPEHEIPSEKTTESDLQPKKIYKVSQTLFNRAETMVIL